MIFAENEQLLTVSCPHDPLAISFLCSISYCVTCVLGSLKDFGHRFEGCTFQARAAAVSRVLYVSGRLPASYPSDRHLKGQYMHSMAEAGADIEQKYGRLPELPLCS